MDGELQPHRGRKSSASKIFQRTTSAIAALSTDRKRTEMTGKTETKEELIRRRLKSEFFRTSGNRTHMPSVALDAYNESTTDLSGTLVDILLQLIACLLYTSPSPRDRG